MIRRPPRSTRTDTLFPYTTLFRSHQAPLVERNRSCSPSCAPLAGAWSSDIASDLETGEGLAHRHQFDAIEIKMRRLARRSEEHTSELQSLMRISYAVFCLKKKNKRQSPTHETLHSHHLIKH